MRTILLADDKKNIRDFCKQELEDEGYRVILACDGHEAIGLVQKEPPDLIVLDICMPRVGGFDAVEPIRAVAPEVPIILFTANDEECMSDERGRYAVACVQKSEDLTQLKRAIVHAMEAREVNEPFRLELPPI